MCIRAIGIRSEIQSLASLGIDERPYSLNHPLCFPLNGEAWLIRRGLVGDCLQLSSLFGLRAMIREYPESSQLLHSLTVVRDLPQLSLGSRLRAVVRKGGSGRLTRLLLMYAFRK
jgi:hypothetical protein